MPGHELRNPLGAMTNALECCEHLSDPASLDESHEVLTRQVRQMSRLVDDLLDVSRITRGKVELRREPIELSKAVSRAVAAITPSLDARRHRLDVTLPAEAVFLNADPARLEQIFANLLQNAIKYTDPGGRIQLQAQAERDEVTIRVRDNGIGMSADLLANIFELFVQGDRSLDRSQGGLGIGLTLVRRLVELHGGQVSVASDGPHQGSEFTVRLPCLVERRNRADQRFVPQARDRRPGNRSADSGG